MKKLLNIFASNKPMCLKDAQKIQIKDNLINISFDNVGTYVPGSRTAKLK